MDVLCSISNRRVPVLTDTCLADNADSVPYISGRYVMENEKKKKAQRLKEYLRKKLKPVLTKIKSKAADAARSLRG